MKFKAWQYDDVRNGPFDANLKLRNDIELPEVSPNSGYVIVQVVAAALNPADWKLPTVWPNLSRILFGRPNTPGLEFCGRVLVGVPAGKGRADALAPGQLVVGKLPQPGKFGTLAQYTRVRAADLVPVPPGLGALDASTLCIAGTTAYQGIITRVKTGDRVLINGGSGGVGTFAIQLAKLAGCHVTTSCSGANIELCRNLGADETVDYRKQDLLQYLKSQGQVFDFVLDCVGSSNELYVRSGEFLKPDGRFTLVAAMESWEGLVTMFTNWLMPTMFRPGARKWSYFLCKSNPAWTGELARWTAEGKISVVVDGVYSFEEVPKAFQRLSTGRARGKVIVQVTEQT